MLIAVNFHYVRPAFDAPHPGIHGITPTQFEAQLLRLGKTARFVGAADLRAAIDGERPLPDQSLVITFDDGLREQYEHALPVLDRLRIPAIFFVNTRPLADNFVSAVHKTHLLRSQIAPAEFAAAVRRLAASRGIELTTTNLLPSAIEHYKYDEPDIALIKYLLNFSLTAELRDEIIEALFAERFSGCEADLCEQLYMNRRQLAELAERDMLGTHAHDHLPLGLLTNGDAARQITDSLRLLHQWTGRTPDALSYPYGSREACAPSVAQAAAEAGVRFAFTMERAANPSLCAPLHLARFDNNDLPGGKAARWSDADLFAAVHQRNWYLE